MSSFEEKKALLAAKKIEAEKKYLDDLHMSTMQKFPTAILHENGCYLVEITKGQGKKIERNNVLEVHYEGRFLDGKVFDSSLPRKKSFQFKIGKGKVIKAWDDCLLNKHVGDKWLIISPYQNAYGESGSPPVIPPKTTLLFEVEILSVS